MLFCPASEAVNAYHWADVASTLLTRPGDLETEGSADSTSSHRPTEPSAIPIDGRSWLVFQLLVVDPNCWLKQPVVKWKEDAEFLAYQRFVKDL